MARSSATKFALCLAVLAPFLAGCSGENTVETAQVKDTPNLEQKSKKNTKNLDLGLE